MSKGELTKKEEEALKAWEEAGRPSNVRCFYCKKGTIITRPVGIDGWATECDQCGFLYDED